ncbi:hypothetical protein [Haloplanus pelagicus]|jgi:hypothetical protein|uniref:hypothetical protein n=1 Tax=Haloplanus pelagicus TaxID=2949995 RepID=UPI002041414C|nr:hypothetical protein [Haloplanus sp. HW8-1]
MEFGTVVVRGEDADDLLAEMTGPKRAMNRTRYLGDTFGVIAWERWDSWRTNSDLMVVVVMELRDDETCEVAVMAGGGGEGAMGLDWSVGSVVADHLLGAERSAEAAAFEEAIEDLEATCESLALTIDLGRDG